MQGTVCADVRCDSAHGTCTAGRNRAQRAVQNSAVYTVCRTHQVHRAPCWDERTQGRGQCGICGHPPPGRPVQCSAVQCSAARRRIIHIVSYGHPEIRGLSQNCAQCECTAFTAVHCRPVQYNAIKIASGLAVQCSAVQRLHCS